MGRIDRKLGNDVHRLGSGPIVWKFSGGISAISESKYVNDVTLNWNYVTFSVRFSLFLIYKKNDEINHDKIKRSNLRIGTKK